MRIPCTPQPVGMALLTSPLSPRGAQMENPILAALKALEQLPPRTWQPPPAASANVKTASVTKRAPPGMSGAGREVRRQPPPGSASRSCSSSTRITSLPTRRLIKAGASTGVVKTTVRCPSPPQELTVASAGSGAGAAASWAGRKRHGSGRSCAPCCGGRSRCRGGRRAVHTRRRRSLLDGSCAGRWCRRRRPGRTAPAAAGHRRHRSPSTEVWRRQGREARPAIRTPVLCSHGGQADGTSCFGSACSNVRLRGRGRAGAMARS